MKLHHTLDVFISNEILIFFFLKILGFCTHKCQWVSLRNNVPSKLCSIATKLQMRLCFCGERNALNGLCFSGMYLFN